MPRLLCPVTMTAKNFREDHKRPLWFLPICVVNCCCCYGAYVHRKLELKRVGREKEGCAKDNEMDRLFSEEVQKEASRAPIVYGQMSYL